MCNLLPSPSLNSYCKFISFGPWSSRRCGRRTSATTVNMDLSHHLSESHHVTPGLITPAPLVSVYHPQILMACYSTCIPTINSLGIYMGLFIQVYIVQYTVSSIPVWTLIWTAPSIQNTSTILHHGINKQNIFELRNAVARVPSPLALHQALLIVRGIGDQRRPVLHVGSGHILSCSLIGKSATGTSACGLLTLEHNASTSDEWDHWLCLECWMQGLKTVSQANMVL